MSVVRCLVPACVLPLGLLVGLVGLVGCVREQKLVDRFVDDFCEARWSCGCESPGLTQVHCESMLTGAGEEAQQAAQDAGLEYDRECAKAWLDAIDDSCTVQPMPADGWQDAECGSPCAVYHGNKGKAEACEAIVIEPNTAAARGAWSDCARGLRCSTLGECEDPCDQQREGDRCDHGDYTTPCAPGLACVPGGVCGRPPALGEPCAGRCAPGGLCDWDQRVCVAAPGFGEPCGDGDACGRNLRCVDDVCDVGLATVCEVGAPW